MELFFLIFISVMIFLLLIVLILLAKGKSKHERMLEKQIEDLHAQLNMNKLGDEQRSQIINANIEQKISTSQIELDNKLNNYNSKSLEIMQHSLNTLDQKLHQQAQIQMQQTKDIIERVSKLDMAQQQIMGLEDSITSLEKTLNDKKARGTFGEIRLETILANIFGEHNTSVWERQYKLANQTIVDFILHTPQPLGDIPIDSKFPLEGYQNILNAQDDNSLQKARKDFETHILKHIKDINKKYLADDNTASQAIMFVPSETIFSEIYAYHEKVVLSSYQQHVWICSPTTIMAILNLLLVVIQDNKRSENAQAIADELSALKIEFDRYQTRWQALVKDINKVSDDVKLLDTTSNKITKKFNSINEGQLDD